MEPAPEERDDQHGAGWTSNADPPHRARPRGAGRSCAGLTSPVGTSSTAMEPAPEERDAFSCRSCRGSADGRNGARSAGAERITPIPVTSRVLLSRKGARSAGAGRLRRRSATGASSPSRNAPSPLRRSGTTSRAAALAVTVGMRNRARSGGAGRPAVGAGRADAGHDAAMEPAPEERDDALPWVRLDPRFRWSPLRRSGTTGDRGGGVV